MSNAAFGRFYADGEIIARQGEAADELYVVQDGTIEIVAEHGASEVVLRSAGRNEILGEMAIFDRRPRSATVRASGPARVLTLDKRAFLRRVHEDPTLAFRILKKMSERIRILNEDVLRLTHQP